MTLLRDSFLDRYKDKEPPFGGNGLGAFVYLRTYARWMPDQQRRESWYDTVKRVVDYSMSLYTGPATQEQQRIEAEALFDNMYNMRLFTAGRTLWIGGTESARKFASSNFNCAFVVFDHIDAFSDLFHLLLVGAGVGFRILLNDVEQLPSFNAKIVVAHKPYNGKVLGDRREDTVVFEESDKDLASVHIVVGDSKEGWKEALKQYLVAMQRQDVESIIFNYDSVRPAGEVLKTFGGRASGHLALKRLFRNIHKVMRRHGDISTKWLAPIDVLDINNFIGASVVVGGVRRTAQIALFDEDDGSVLDAKVGLFETGHVNFGNDQRFMSNNSIFFESKPTRERLLDIFDRIQNSSEPGFVNAVAARERRPNFQGLNPCAEILLDSQGVCNLTEINMMAFVNNAGVIDHSGLEEAIILATRVGLRQTNVDIDLSEWNIVQKRDRLLGVSLDGVMDFMDASNLTNDALDELLQQLRAISHKAAQDYAFEMRVPMPLLITTEKPSGTLSKLPAISSGVHRSRAPYYIRRVRISATDPLARVMLESGYSVYPENASDGLTVEEFDSLSSLSKWQTLQESDTWVVEFPMKSTTKIGINDEPAVSQFNRYLMFQRAWTDHNTSITITFDPDEVEPLVDAILENWDNYVAVSFMPKDTSEYPLLPEQEITEDEYLRLVDELLDRRSEYVDNKSFHDLLIMYETTDQATELLDASCFGGSCPVR